MEVTLLWWSQGQKPDTPWTGHRSFTGQHRGNWVMYLKLCVWTVGRSWEPRENLSLLPTNCKQKHPEDGIQTQDLLATRQQPQEKTLPLEHQLSQSTLVQHVSSCPTKNLTSKLRPLKLATALRFFWAHLTLKLNFLCGEIEVRWLSDVFNLWKQTVETATMEPVCHTRFSLSVVFL